MISDLNWQLPNFRTSELPVNFRTFGQLPTNFRSTFELPVNLRTTYESWIHSPPGNFSSNQITARASCWHSLYDRHLACTSLFDLYFGSHFSICSLLRTSLALCWEWRWRGGELINIWLLCLMVWLIVNDGCGLERGWLKAGISHWSHPNLV